MFPKVLCVCGRQSGCYFDAFSELKRKKYQDYCKEHGIEDIHPEYSKYRINLELGDILDMLGIERECCRVTLLTQVLFRELY